LVESFQVHFHPPLLNSLIELQEFVDLLLPIRLLQATPLLILHHPVALDHPLNFIQLDKKLYHLLLAQCRFIELVAQDILVPPLHHLADPLKLDREYLLANYYSLLRFHPQ